MSEQPSSNQLFPDRYSVPCCQGPDADGCACGFTEERSLRAIIAGQHRPMTEAEREYCKNEITSVEGYDDRDTGGSDADLARMVLSAWMDYCRDKGLL